MRNRVPVTLVLLIGIFIFSQTAPAQGPFTLSYKLEKGKPYLYGDTISVESTQEMMGQEQKTTANVLSLTRIVPTELTGDGSSVLELSSDSISIHLKTPQMDTLLTPRDMFGKRTRLTLSRTGEVSNRKVVDSIVAGGIMRAFGQREAFRFHHFPAKEVKVGDTWSLPQTDSADAMGGKMVTVSTFNYTLKGKETKMGKDCLKLAYTGKMTVTGKGSMMGMQVFVEGSGKVGGTVYVDASSCMPMYEESRADMESTAAITGQQNMTIPSSQTVITHRAMVSK